MSVLCDLLCDALVSISQTAIRILESATNENECLETLVTHLSVIVHLDVGMESLIIKSLSSITGIQYLQDTKKLNFYLEKWAIVNKHHSI